MKQCLICQTSQDQVSLKRISVSMESKPWADLLVCANCVETLGAAQVRDLIRIAVQEKSYEAANMILADAAAEAAAAEAAVAEAASAEAAKGSDDEDDGRPRTLDLPVSAALLRDPQAFAERVGAKVGAKLWEMHRKGVSEAVWSSSLTPDGEDGFVFSAIFGRPQG